MRKIDNNLFKNSKVENVFFLITFLVVGSIGLLFVIGGTTIIICLFLFPHKIVSSPPYIMNLGIISIFEGFILCIFILETISSYLSLFNLPYTIEVKDHFLECQCFLKKWKIKYEDIIKIKIFRGPLWIWIGSISPLHFILKIKSKDIWGRYIFIRFAYNQKGSIFDYLSELYSYSFGDIKNELEGKIQEAQDRIEHVECSIGGRL